MSEPVSAETARAIEAILMVAQEPVETHLLAQLLEVAPAIVEETCEALRAAYEEQGRGFELAKVAGGYRFQSHGDLAAYVERFVLEGQTSRLSSAALETLAIVAYKQPLSRAQVAAIRGVNVDGVMRTLQQRGYIAEVGRDPGPGQAALFATTPEFLERMGLDRIEDLPAISALFPSPEVMEALERTLRADPIDQDGASAPPAPPEASDRPERSDRPAATGGTGPVDPAPALEASDERAATESDPGLADRLGPDLADEDVSDLEPPPWAIDP